MSELARLTAWVHGDVQGVGFRWWTRSQALELGLAGSAKNLDDGRVCVVAEGSRDAVAELLRRLAVQPGENRRPGEVTTVVTRWAAPKGESGFVKR
ncbi:acylphosphatase [Corynebacterium sp. A21]|uniref:acylphosphatase n=1 Tax=Corynebacterium sp. A21 TaxID=3457318 RepID=UPI003FD4BB15